MTVVVWFWGRRDRRVFEIQILGHPRLGSSTVGDDDGLVNLAIAFVNESSKRKPFGTAGREYGQKV